MPTPAEDFYAHWPQYDREHIEVFVEAVTERGTPYCWECHDWHGPDEYHSVIKGNSGH